MKSKGSSWKIWMRAWTFQHLSPIDDSSAREYLDWAVFSFDIIQTLCLPWRTNIWQTRFLTAMLERHLNRLRGCLVSKHVAKRCKCKTVPPLKMKWCIRVTARPPASCNTVFTNPVGIWGQWQRFVQDKKIKKGVRHQDTANASVLTTNLEIVITSDLLFGLNKQSWSSAGGATFSLEAFLIFLYSLRAGIHAGSRWQHCVTVASLLLSYYCLAEFTSLPTIPTLIPCALSRQNRK